MTRTSSVEERTGRAQQILARCVCLVLERHYLGNNRKVDVDDLVEKSGGTFTLDERMFSATKALIDSKYLAPARSVQNRARAMLRSVALPAYKTFGDSAYLVPLPIVRKVNDDLNTMAAELRAESVKLASTVYEKAIEEQREKLGPMFKIGDYLRPEQVADAFRIDWRFVSFAAPENLESVDHALAEAADQKYHDQLANAFDEVLMGLRASALEIVSDLVERLTPDEHGRPRIMRSSALDALRQFAELLPTRNVGGDNQLAKAIANLTKRAEGVDVQQLRDSTQVRAGLHAAATAAQQALAALVQQGPRRGIRLPGAAA